MMDFYSKHTVLFLLIIAIGIGIALGWLTAPFGFVPTR